MQFLAPVGFGLLALAIPILLLYMLKLRRKPVQVSSTLLWTRLLRDRQANTPWQKLKRNLLFFLQLLILSALVLAFARPAIQRPAIASGSVIVLLDGSASMNATDVDPSRFEAARRAIQPLIDGLSGGERMTLILAGGIPQTLSAAETDKALLREALAEARPGQGGTDWQAAFALAASAARGSQSITTVIISDGGLPETGLPALPGEVRYLPVGAANNNLAIGALALRPAAGGPELFAQVTNYSDADRTVLLSFYQGDDLVTARQLELPAGSSRGLTLDNLPNTPGVYKARISDPQNNTSPDSLALDDTAFAVYQSTSARRVLLVSKGNLFLEQLLASLPGIQPFRALPTEDGKLQIPAEPFDLFLLDGILPAELPAGNLLLINPSSNALFEVGASFNEMKNVRVQEHVLTRFVDWSAVHVRQARAVAPPDWAEVLIDTEGGPLVFAGETGGRRVAVLTFDLHESDLPLQVAYPILFSNLINYLIPPGAFDATRSLHPGESLSIVPPPGTQRVVIVSPSNQVSTLAPAATALSFTRTNELGYYAVNFISQGATVAEYFAVNLFDPSESKIEPRRTIQVGRTAVSAAGAEQVGQRELWPWLILLALLLLLIEWQLYYRKPYPSASAAREASTG